MLSLRDQLLDEFDRLTPEKQQRVVNFARSLNNTLPPGIPGEVLIELAKTLNFSSEDLAQMEAAINDPVWGYEKIDWEGWDIDLFKDDAAASSPSKPEAAHSMSTRVRPSSCRFRPRLSSRVNRCS